MTTPTRPLLGKWVLLCDDDGAVVQPRWVSRVTCWFVVDQGRRGCEEAT
jgi:hypothetical protein